MRLDKKKADFLCKAIDEWQSQQLLSDEQAQLMKQSISVRKFDWRQVTVYAFIIAVACAVLSVIVLLADKPLRAIIEKFTQITDFGISCILSVFTLLVFWYTDTRFRKQPDTPFSNGSFLLFGAFLSLTMISYWVKTLHVFQQHPAFVFLLAALVYVPLAAYFRSQTLWVLGGLMLAIAFGLYTENRVEGFCGLNLPMRFIPFSVLILSILTILRKVQSLKPFFRAHYVMGLLLFYLSLWLVTIFGNYSSYERWQEVKQIQFLIWDGLLFTVAGVGMYFGLKRHDFVLGNMSLVFFMLNLVTRYFEYCWAPLHKSVFFMILSFIFWFIGSRAEKLWNLKFLEEKSD
ncbi:MAG: hypothetical protein U0X41_08680 [Chitinophagales bacterium]